MSKVVVIAGYGTGISHSVASRLAKGHKLALISRTAPKLDSAVIDFKEKNIEAHAYVTDLSDPHAVAETLKNIQNSLGSISILFWNGGGVFKPLMSCSIDDLKTNMSINVISLIHAVQTVQDDLATNKGAVLVTGGGFGADHQHVNKYIVSLGVGTGGVNKAAEHKVSAILHEELKMKGIYVGTVIVTQMVKGTAWDNGSATLEPEAVADAFEKLVSERAEPSVTI